MAKYIPPNNIYIHWNVKNQKERIYFTPITKQITYQKPVIKNNIVYAKYIFEERFAGGPGLVHGGILSAALDDLMGYATVIHNRMCVTANLEVNYLIPVPVEEEYELFAWVKGIEGKKITTESIIKKGDNVHVESKGLFIDLGENAFKHFAPEKNYP